MNWSIKTYEQLYDLYKDLKEFNCPRCKCKTLHFRRGFKGNNERWSCLLEEELNED